MINTNYPPEPTTKSQVDSTLYDAELLGQNTLGTVHIHGVYGNRKSENKIAYSIGMHPYESKAHRALFEVIEGKNKKLNHQYYIYNINVKNKDNSTEGRMDGQLLAKEYVKEHIIGNDYTFFVDIHSNKGLVGPGKYEKTNFIFAPNFDAKSEQYMNKILSDIPELTYYAPEYRTSPEYITVPVAKSGTATIVYETYSYEEMNRTIDLIEKLVESIDKIKF